MLSDIVLWLTNILIALLLINAIRGKFLTKYVLFFSYLSYVLAIRVVRTYVYSFRPEEYLTFYWYTQFLSVAMGYGITWEIYLHVLKEYPGTSKMARSVVSVFFLCVLGIALFNAFDNEASALVRSVIRFERDLRAVQAVLLTVLLVLIRYYAIPLGRNLWGLILGYGSFIGVGVITLTLRSYLGMYFQIWWQYLQQVSYLVATMIWVSALWVYAPSPKPDIAIRLEEDYAFLAERTYRAITKARDSVLRVFLS